MESFKLLEFSANGKLFSRSWRDHNFYWDNTTGYNRSEAQDGKLPWPSLFLSKGEFSAIVNSTKALSLGVIIACSEQDNQGISIQSFLFVVIFHTYRNDCL